MSSDHPSPAGAAAPRAPRGFRPEPFAYHDELELPIDTLTNEGVGLGRVDSWVVMVRHALPGERVRARVYRNHKNFSEADLLEVLAPSPERIDAPCPVFGTCGGCQYQNLAYPAQLRWKQRQVAELLQHLAGVEHEVDPVIPSPRQYGYRSKLTPHHQKPRQGDLGPIGFLQGGSRSRLVDVPQCPIAMPEINAALTDLRRQLRATPSSRKRGATLLLRADADGRVVTDHAEVIEERVGRLSLRFQAGDFFQNNPFILPAFAAHVAAEAAADGARHLVDAYCGSGLFALAAADRFASVTGIEISESSVEWARRNAAANDIGHAGFIASPAEAVFRDISTPPGETAVIMDPPRRGSDPGFLGQLTDFKPLTVVYVSCNPATQMRDLRQLLDAGYRIARVQPFDLFPQTRHLECVIRLRHRDGNAAASARTANPASRAAVPVNAASATAATLSAGRSATP